MLSGSRLCVVALIEDTFINYLFEIIENIADDVNDPYHYPIIRVVVRACLRRSFPLTAQLVLNEQYMVCAHDPSPTQRSEQQLSLTNKVLRVLANHGSAYKSFGQNIILLLNRESETSLQLLILKLLYLLFTSPPTYEYFYTNDLHVLLDIILRNLLDLPPSASALRHTYLRVLFPFLSHSQLKHPPHYKQEDVQRLLSILSGNAMGHFGEIDETTQRLVARCSKISWLREDDVRPISVPNDPEDELHTPNSLAVVAIPQALESSLSVLEVASQRSRPGVKTPSKRSHQPDLKFGSDAQDGTKMEDQYSNKFL